MWNNTSNFYYAHVYSVDYKVHKHVVEIILDKHYEKLWGASADDLAKDEILDFIMEVFKWTKK
jgi:hypothetical protein